MDISKASNFERFVFDLLGRDAARTAQLFGVDVARGGFELDAEAFARVRDFAFVSGRSTHADRVATIRDTFGRHGVTIDPHTADGLKVAREHPLPGATTLVLETALPIKFAGTIREALGHDPERPAALEGLENLPRRFKVMPVDADAIKGYIADTCGR
jgi:threonine synthase